MVKFDPRLLRELRRTEIDFVNQLDVYRRRPRQWALSCPVIPTKWVDERNSRLCEKEFEQSSSDVESAMSRKIMVLDDSALCCIASALSEMAIELQFDEQAVCQFLLGEVSYSLLGM